MAYYPPVYGSYQNPQPNYPAMTQSALSGQQTAPQQGFTVRPVAGREEAVAMQTDFFGPGIIMPDLSHGVVYIKRFNQQTGASDLLEFVYAPPQQRQEISGDYVSMDMFRQLFQRVEALEKKGGTVNGTDE